MATIRTTTTTDQDPLGYDGTVEQRLRAMAEDAVAGRNSEAVAAEAAVLRARLRQYRPTVSEAALSRRQSAALDAIVHDVGVRSADRPTRADVVAMINQVVKSGALDVQQLSLARRVLVDSQAVELRILLGGEVPVEAFLDQLVQAHPQLYKAGLSMLMDLRLDPRLVQLWQEKVAQAIPAVEGRIVCATEDLPADIVEVIAQGEMDPRHAHLDDDEPEEPTP